MTADHEPTVAEIEQSEFDARAELRRKLLDGTDTEPTRAAIAEFSKRLKAEVARVSLDAEAKAESKRLKRETRRRQIAAKFASTARAEIARCMAPIAIPAPIKELK
jgi:hypothetical protein